MRPKRYRYRGYVCNLVDGELSVARKTVRIGGKQHVVPVLAIGPLKAIARLPAHLRAEIREAVAAADSERRVQETRERLAAQGVEVASPQQAKTMTEETRGAWQ